MFSFHLINHPETFNFTSEKLEEISSSIEKIITKPQNGSINIAFLTDDEIRKFNSEYRNIDKTTDVLSFHYHKDFLQCQKDEVAGEIILSESKIINQAKEHAHSEEKETLILILHGLLHILGYDHETDDDYSIMWKYEKKLRGELNLL